MIFNRAEERTRIWDSYYYILFSDYYTLNHLSRHIAVYTLRSGFVDTGVIL